jgi:hypothetical protein
MFQFIGELPPEVMAIEAVGNSDGSYLAARNGRHVQAIFSRGGPAVQRRRIACGKDMDCARAGK